jgi:hypothetical protein
MCKYKQVPIIIEILLIGYPIAKSLLCVVNIAKRAERPKFEGLVLIIEIIKTRKKTILLAMNTASKNLQLTFKKSSLAIDKKISAGKEKVPTNVFSPFASPFVITSNLPAIYLKLKGHEYKG